jgi:hypothetical protein
MRLPNEWTWWLCRVYRIFHRLLSDSSDVGVRSRPAHHTTHPDATKPAARLSRNAPEASDMLTQCRGLPTLRRWVVIRFLVAEPYVPDATKSPDCCSEAPSATERAHSTASNAAEAPGMPTSCRGASDAVVVAGGQMRSVALGPLPLRIHNTKTDHSPSYTYTHTLTPPAAPGVRGTGHDATSAAMLDLPCVWSGVAPKTLVEHIR